MNVAIIPARGGSKRIPKKNIRIFHGQPILKYSIDTAKKSGLFDRIIVSTDNEEIAEIAKNCGADVPFIRPKHLSDDFVTTDEVIEHSLNWLKERGEHYKYSCTIYATAPFLQARFLNEAYDRLKESSAVKAFSATSSSFPAQRMFKITKSGRCRMFSPEHYLTRSQDLESSYHDAGQFYWSAIGCKPDDVMFGGNSIPIILPRYLVQ
ncbi:pseudaminic acid cytidylyltransferase, partial [Gammaproteobacteria bacterium]|nr:pseudaminic acid cytidylyltransferase [Gammaproteobacteria bacterium]